MKKLLTFFGSKQFIMRFVRSGALRLDRQRYAMHFGVLRELEGFLVEQLQAAGMPTEGSVTSFEIPAARFERWRRLFDSSCVRYRGLSPSFETRAEMHRLNGGLSYWKLAAVSLPGVYEARRWWVRRFASADPGLLGVIREVAPDRVLLPSALLDRLTDDVLLACTRAGVACTMLSANWDNLSSKGLLTFLPDHLVCWGEQTRRHASDIQGLPLSRTVAIGAPHLELLLRARSLSRDELREKAGVRGGQKLILFAGSFRAIDETALLRELDEAISSGRLPSAKVLYRPHPWRMARQEEDFRSIGWKNVEIDPAMLESYGKVRASGAAEDSDFDLLHLGSLYRASDAVISPMSTALLEGLEFGVPMLALNFGDGKHFWSPDKAGLMLHFREFFELPGILVLRDRARFLEQVEALLALDQEAFAREILPKLEFFVVTKPGSYPERLTAALEGPFS